MTTGRLSISVAQAKPVTDPVLLCGLHLTRITSPIGSDSEYTGSLMDRDGSAYTKADAFCQST